MLGVMDNCICMFPDTPSTRQSLPLPLSLGGLFDLLEEQNGPEVTLHDFQARAEKVTQLLQLPPGDSAPCGKSSGHVATLGRDHTESERKALEAPTAPAPARHPT